VATVTERRYRDVHEELGTHGRRLPLMIWQHADDAVAALVLAHGAGAGMTHANMQAIAAAFAGRGIATLRFNFPFIDAGRQRVDPPAVAIASIAAAFAAAAEETSLPIWLGGHSFGGRMASHAVLDVPLEPRGLIFCSFPLHSPGKPTTLRAQHLSRISTPMLFLSGTRDALAESSLLEPLVRGLSNAELHLLETADHGYRVLKRTRRSTEDIFDEMARVARDFIDRQAAEG
jgi:predicted alpha/beta-hydrolase family hydrolase